MAEEVGRRLGDRHQQILWLLQAQPALHGKALAAHGRDDPGCAGSPREHLVHHGDRPTRRRLPGRPGVGQPAERGPELARHFNRPSLRRVGRPTGPAPTRGGAVERAGRNEPGRQVVQTAEEVARDALDCDFCVHEVERAVVAHEDKRERVGSTHARGSISGKRSIDK